MHNPYEPTAEDWKEMAKQGVVRARNFCFPGPDWRPTAGELAELGLAPSDTTALLRALSAAHDRMWRATLPGCAKLVGKDEAERLGESCHTVILNSVSEHQRSLDAQIVADVRAGNTPMPPLDSVDALTVRLFAMTSAITDFEMDLTGSFGPEVAHRIAAGEQPWGQCMVQLGRPWERHGPP